VPPAVPMPLPNATDATVAFDRNHNFYITYVEHKADFSTGYVVMQKYSFMTLTPSTTPVIANSIVYAWTGVDSIFHPCMEIAANPTAAPGHGAVDPKSANNYVACAHLDDAPTRAVNFKQNSIKHLVSPVGGASFGPYAYLNPSPFAGGPNAPAMTLPSIAV